MVKKLLKTCFVLAFVSSALWISTANTHAALLTVNDPGDAGDAVPGDGICATGGGFCTLRAGVEEGNALAGTDTIEFSANYLISTGSTLTVTDTLIIDGYSCPGYSGNSGPDMGGAFDDGADFTIGCTISGLDEFTDLFHFSGAGADGSVLRGLGLINYRYGAYVDGVDGFIANHNMFGLNDLEVLTGTQEVGIYVDGGSDGTSIGTPETGNIFARLSGFAATDIRSASNTTYEGNTCGTTKDGETNLAGVNEVVGACVAISAAASDTAILGSRLVDASVGISSSSSTNVTIKGNDIGFGADNGNGEEDLGHSGNGISLVITGASLDIVGTDGDGVDDALEGNDIAGNGLRGINIDATGSTANTTVAGNNIGITRNGTALANDGDGVLVTGEHLTIGSNEDAVSDSEEANTFYGNGDNGLRLVAGSDNIEINGNTFDTNFSRGIRIDAGATLEIKDNFFTGHTSFNAMEFYGGGGIGVEIVRNHFDGNRVGISTEGLDAFLTIGGLSLTDANYFYNTTLHGVHMHGGTFSPVYVQWNYFGIEPNLVTLGPNGYNVSIRNESSSVYNNEMYATNTGAHIENFQDGVADPIFNTFSENNFYGAGLAHDLGGNGVTADNGSYPELAPTPNEGIDPVENMAAVGFVISGDAEPGATIEIYQAADGSVGMATGGDYLVTTTANGGGAWSYDLTGLVSAGDYVNAAQTEGGNTSEFAAGVEIVIATPSGGSGRRRIENVLATQDYTAPIGLPSKLLQGVDVDNSSEISTLTYRSLDEDPQTIFEVSPNENRDDIFFTSFLKNIASFLTAMVWGEENQVALVFEGNGSEDYFVPLEAGEYEFSVEATHPSGNNTTGDFTVTVEAPQLAAQNCADYSALNSYYQMLSSIQICSEPLDDDLETIKQTTKAAIPVECLEQVAPPQLSCIEVEKCIDPDFEAIKQLYLETIRPVNFDTIFPADEETYKPIRGLVDDLTTSLDDHFGAAHNIERIEQSQCEYKYTYYDYPGEYQFKQYGFDNNVVMIYQIENIFSGLITGKILGSYINLIRSHAIIAVSRLFQDQNGVFWALFDEKDFDVEHVDVDPQYNPLQDIYSQYEQGYSLEEAIVIALEEDDFISFFDLTFLAAHINQLKANGQTTDDTSRFLFPTSDVRRIDMIEMIESSIHLNELFDSKSANIELPEAIDNPVNQVLVAPYYELGIMTQLEYLNHPIPRGEAFTIFYRLQQLNHFLRDELDLLGVEIEKDGTFVLQGEPLSQADAKDIMKRIISEVLNGNENIRLILKARTEPFTSEFWESWNAFTSATGYPYDNIQELLINKLDINLQETVKMLEGAFRATLN